MTATDNFNFVPKPITSAVIRLGDGSNICVAMATIQRMAALRAYQAFSEQGDWLQKFSHAYVVALATRSADSLLMKAIQEKLNELLPIACRQCRESTYGSALIRERLFPRLKELRVHVNALIHHLDEPGNKGVSSLNVEAVFDYCYCLFEEHLDALFGTIPAPHGKFPVSTCKRCNLQ
ncbi:MAG: hypothetical protein WAT68_06300 [Candidatus Nitrotoga sp.]